MGDLFKPDKPKVPAPPPLPDLDAEKAEGREKAIAQFRKRRGRRSTILTAGQETQAPALRKTLSGS